MKNNNVFKAISYNCIGCGLCEAICPKKCIEINEVGNKGLLPVIKEDKCTNCGICIKVCPTNKIIEMEKIDIIKQICIGKSKNKNIVKYSS